MFLHDIYHGQRHPEGRDHSRRPGLTNAQFRPEMNGVDVPHDIYSHIAGIDIVRARRRRGRVLRAGGQPARAVAASRYMLEEPQDDDAAVPGPVRAAPRRAGRALSRPAARHAALGRARRRRRADRRGADARACTTPPISSTRSSPSRWASSWSRARTCSSRTTMRLHAHHAGPEARRRDLPPRRRRLPRSARLPPGLGARRARAAVAPIAPATSRWPTRSAPASPTTRRSTPTCRRSSSFYLGEEADPEQRADLPLPRARRSCLRARPPAGAGGQGSPRLRRLRHAGRPGRDQGRDRGVPRAAQGASPTRFIAQPTLALSTCPTFVEAGLAPRHVDLRPFVLSGKDSARSCPAA